MRVLHINCNYIGTTLHQLMIEELDNCGIENQVFVPTYDKSISTIKPNDNVIVSECFNKRDRIWFDYKQSKIIKNIEELYDISSFDLIHAYTLFTDGNVAKVLSEKYGIPYVVAVRNTDVNNFFAKMVHLRSRGISILCSAKKVFFLSMSYQNLVFDKYVPLNCKDVLLKKVRIIPNGIDWFWFQNRPKNEKIINRNEIKLIYAGRIDKNKNIQATQKAMMALRQHDYNVTLTVVGKIVDQHVYKNIAKNPFTTTLPAMSKEKLIEIYRSSDIFIMPSITESFGLVYAEAMSQGIPVIYSKGQGFDGQFENGVVGYSVDKKNIEEIENAIIKIINNYSEISKKCLKEVSKFEWNEQAKQYLLIYKEIVGE